MQRYLDKLVGDTRSGKQIKLPLWAKVWPSCIILGCALANFPFSDGCRIMELGAGSAVNGLVLAKRGFGLTCTDVDPDALLFSKINVLKNGLAESIEILRSDFTCDNLGRSFEYIIGCEILYDEIGFASLVDYLDEHLSEDSTAEIIIAIDRKRQVRKFFEFADQRFNVMKSSVKYREEKTGDENVINLFRLKRKSN